MNLSAITRRPLGSDSTRAHFSDHDVLVSDSKYVVRIAANPSDMINALRLRHDVFHVEMGVTSSDTDLDFDAYDFRSEHLIAIERSSGKTIGTYRVNSVPTISEASSLYCYEEFEVEKLPEEIILHGAEIGRACIASHHRNSRALFLLWKGLAKHLELKGKRYFFGCCSIFTREPNIGARAYHQLARAGHLHESIRILPRRNPLEMVSTDTTAVEYSLPHLFEMYLRLGAKVCGPPMLDKAFGTVDFFVMFDLESINERYRRVFLS